MLSHANIAYGIGEIMLRNRLKYALRPVVAKPWNCPAMEFRYGLWMGVSALFSDSGRQLGEENTRPFILNHHIPAQTHPCKYAGSREGRPINMSALRIAMQNFDAALEITRAVGEYHLRHLSPASHSGQQPASSEGPGIWDLYIISRASIAVIAYQMRYRGGPKAPDLVPDALASQYQFISGIFMICRDMLNNGSALIQANAPLSAQQLYDYADDKGIFISFNGMACAGSTKKITEFLEFCLDIMPTANPQKSAKTGMDHLVTDAGNWYRYALSTIELDCFIEAEAQHRRMEAGAGKAEQLQPSRAHYRAVADYCQSLLSQIDDDQQAKHNQAEPDNSDSFTAGILARQNAILKLLKRPAIRRISAKHLRARLGV